MSAGKTIDKLFVQKGLKGDQWVALREKLQADNIKYLAVPPEKLNRLTRKNHQGVVAFLSPVEFIKLEHLIPSIYERGETPLLLFLDGITDVRNFGAILRTAECAGVHGIIIPVKGAAPVSNDAAKTSAGALYRIPLCKETSIARAIQFCKDSGIQTVGSTEKTDAKLYDIDMTVPTAVVMGNEETGISDGVLHKLDKLAQIPLNGEIGSLNVSVASGVVLYEAVRQRI